MMKTIENLALPSFFNHSFSCVVACSWIYRLPYIFHFFSYAYIGKTSYKQLHGGARRLEKPCGIRFLTAFDEPGSLLSLS